MYKQFKKNKYKIKLLKKILQKFNTLIQNYFI